MQNCPIEKISGIYSRPYMQLLFKEAEILLETEYDLENRNFYKKYLIAKPIAEIGTTIGTNGA
jgi:hypothetical protein